jgi:GMP synthase-like glutamine amidotransferase
MMNIGLLECDHIHEKFRHIAGDYRQMFAELLSRFAPEVTLTYFDVCNGNFPAATDECDGWLCSGSRFSVYDDEGWISALKSFVRELRASGRPFVGICFGHQMLAEALGGKVAKAEQGWGVGVQNIKIVHPEAWMQPWQTSLRLQYMHQDQVQRLPAESVVLARSEHCPIAIFRAGANLLGIQAHPEFPAAYSAALLRDRRERIGAGRVETGLASLGQLTDEKLIAGWMMEFLRQNRM